MSDARNGLSARDSHIWSLRMAVILLALLSGGLMAVISAKQNLFTLQLPADLSKGAVVKPGEYYGSNAYIFGQYMWRTLNEWSVSGKNDYSAAIEANECYLTPSFKQWLLADKDRKASAGELDRTRRLIPASPYREENVMELAGNTFSITLNVNLIEEIGDKKVKNSFIQYPLRVVPDYRLCNKQGLSLDGFSRDPKKLTDAEIKRL